jgi:HNH endonuclease
MRYNCSIEKVSPALLKTTGGLSAIQRIGTMYDYTSKDLIRFNSKIHKSQNSDDCWLWTAGINPSGHAIFWLKGVNILAHRLAYELAYGEIPKGLSVLHDCPHGDNARCCNPAHLWLGTIADNNKDRAVKGRSGDNKGEKHNMAKLTEKDILSIRRRWSLGGITKTQLGKEYGVHRGTIYHVVNYTTWTHVK